MNVSNDPPEIRVMVVDDSSFFRATVRHALAEIPGARLVATAANGLVALNLMAKEAIDLVVLDIEMPVMGGIETLAAIRERYPKVGVVILTAATTSAAELTMRALELGALDFLPKGQSDDARKNCAELVRQLGFVIAGWTQQGTAANVRSSCHTPTAEGKTLSPGRASDLPSRSSGSFALTRKGLDTDGSRGMTSERQSGRAVPIGGRLKLSVPTLMSRVEVVVIGSSTGGPQALGQVIPALPKSLPVPVLVVQHMPPVFTGALARDLNGRSPLEVLEAEQGMLVEPGKVLIAPGGRHAVVRSERDERGVLRRFVNLNDDPPENSCRPAVDVLFRSIASAYEGQVLAVILTGMGEDGAKGVQTLKQKNCYCLTQSAETCVVFGMPKAVERLGLSDERVPLALIGSRIVQLVEQPRRATAIGS